MAATHPLYRAEHLCPGDRRGGECILQFDVTTLKEAHYWCFKHRAKSNAFIFPSGQGLDSHHQQTKTSIDSPKPPVQET